MENRLSQKQRLFPNCLRISNQLSLVYLGLFFLFYSSPFVLSSLLRVGFVHL